MKKNYAKALLILALLPASVLAAIPTYDFKVVNTYPHDPQAFTEGLLYRDGFLYESTGLKKGAPVVAQKSRRALLVRQA